MCDDLRPPDAPEPNSHRIATNQINLVWSASLSAAGYIIERGGSPIATTSVTITAITGLSPSTQYCYMIAATNGIGSSLFSSPACATTPGRAANIVCPERQRQQLSGYC